MIERSASAGYLTNWAARLFARAIDRRLTKLGVSSGQLPVFFALGGGAAMTQKELTKVAAIEQPTMAATLSRMERDGLVVRRANPKDGRSVLYALTAEAQIKARGVEAAIGEVNDRALSGLKPEERAAYLESLKRVIAALDESEGD